MNAPVEVPSADPEGDDPRADLRWGTVPNAVRDAVARGGDREAIVDGDARWTWTDLGREVDRATSAFLAAGIEPGERVAIWAPNCAEWVVALFGLHGAGAVLVPLNTRYKGAEAADILARSRARVLVTVDGFLGNHYVGMLDGHDLPHLERIVVLRADDEPAEPAESWERFLAGGEGVDPAAADERRASLAPESVADLLFTSGTTGKPKGVICAHGQLLRTVATWANVVGLGATDRYVAVNPFFHSFGYKAGIIAWLVTGGTLLPVPVFDVPEVMRLIATERGSMLPGAPTLYQTILNHPDRHQLDSSSLRLAVTGAASVPVSLVEQMRDDLGFDTVITAYGLTEACGFATMCRRSDDATTIATTAGRAMPGIEVQVVGDDGSEVATGEPGEVVVRGYNVMAGYFEDPAATAEAIDADGWLHTGDIGVMDARGNLKITDRKKDLFICGGFNAYPAEIENLLLAHPDIAQVAVIGVPDDRMGEVGTAFVVATTGTTPDPAEIVDWAREHMANFKAPRTVHIVDALPFNPGGKVMKFELRNRLQEAP
ncbi:MAG: Acyl-CoA synthetase [Acidimicrobiales bacterium]|nr:Acyl-CoA synthetase [Acidimicrobiales bacterium]